MTTTTEPEPSVEDEVSGPAGTAVAVAVTMATPLWFEPEGVIVSAFPSVVEGLARAEVIVRVRTPFASVVVEVAMIVSDSGFEDDEGAKAELERGDGKTGTWIGDEKRTETCQRRRIFS